MHGGVSSDVIDEDDDDGVGGGMQGVGAKSSPTYLTQTQVKGG